MKLIIYYALMLVVNILSVVLFRDSISIDFFSVLPAFLIILMCIQASMFKVDMHISSVGDTAYSTSNTVRLTDEELKKQYEYLKYSFYILIPFVVTFIFFFDSYLKLLSVIVYIFAYILGGIIFIIKNGKSIKKRFESEKEELSKQKQNEELGKWK